MATFNKYYKEDFEDYIADPAKHQAKAKAYGLGECMPVDLNQTFQPAEKYGKDNLKMAQYNIRDRFGDLQDPEDEAVSDF